MKGNRCLAALAVLATLLFNRQFATSQSFTDLDFEQAKVPRGTAVDGGIPFGTAFPGWTGFTLSQSGPPGSNVVSEAGYDLISLGGVYISLIDSNAASSGAGPLDGRYSLALFGGLGGADLGPYTAGISQTGLVPQGTRTLLIDVQQMVDVFGSTFYVSLNGQNLNLVPVETYSNYTEYGADITAFANQTATLSISVPCPPTYVEPPITPPYAYMFDDIVFSSTSIPEPGMTALWGVGLSLAFIFRFFHNTSKPGDFADCRLNLD